MRNVSEVLKAMLTENTGRAMGDSGDAYGRNHERNQGVDFDSLPSVTVDTITTETSTQDICYTINTYHYLNNQLEFDEFTEKVNNKLDELRSLEDKDYPHWDAESVDAIEKDVDVIEEDKEIIDRHQVNTYNYDSHLSQVLQYTAFEYDDEYYALIQIHGGCDVRGGYTDAVCFKLNGDYGCATLRIEDVYGTIDGVAVSNTYDGYYLYGDDYDDDATYEQYVKVTKDSVIELEFYGE